MNNSGAHTNRSSATAWLCLGSSLSHREVFLRDARRLIDELAGRIVAASAIYETRGWQTRSENWYLNQVLRIETALVPRDLMDVLLAIEASLGRQRFADRNQDRVIDIDILFYDQLIVNGEELEIPHPRLHLRRFVLVPLAEIAPQIVHPVLQKTVAEMLLDCPDTLEVRPAAVKE